MQKIDSLFLKYCKTDHCDCMKYDGIGLVSTLVDLNEQTMKSNNVYNQMQRMADLTITMVLSGKMARAKKFLDTAEKLFLKGNFQTRNAVSNVFVYKLSTVLELHHGNLRALLPGSLHKEYVKQINAF